MTDRTELFIIFFCKHTSSPVFIASSMGCENRWDGWEHGLQNIRAGMSYPSLCPQHLAQLRLVSSDRVSGLRLEMEETMASQGGLSHHS